MGALPFRALQALRSLLAAAMLAGFCGPAAVAQSPAPDPVTEVTPVPATCLLKVVATVPVGAGAVYLSGNLPELGPWVADRLAMAGDGTRRTAELRVPCGTLVEFKLTAGTWEREALDEQGGIGGNHSMIAEKDAEMAVTVAAFRRPYDEVFAEGLREPAWDGVPLAVVSPKPWQVIQRRTGTEGDVLISGRVRAEGADRVVVRIIGPAAGGAGAADRRVEIVPGPDGRFLRSLTLPAGGWYRLEAEARKGEAIVAETAVERFGIGEVFVTAGQSNSTNSGQYPTKQTSGMVSAFGGTWWQRADDPLPGCHDRSLGGSPWPAFGDALAARLGVPIGIAATGHGGTSTRDWAPGGELHTWMMTRAGQLGPGGFRAILWHQGESDWAMESEEYFTRMKAIVEGSRTAAGWDVPWFTALATYHNMKQPRWPQIRAAQERLWAERVSLAGPDTDVLQSPARDLGGAGIHFSPEGLRAHGTLWAEKVAPWVEAVTGP